MGRRFQGWEVRGKLPEGRPSGQVRSGGTQVPEAEGPSQGVWILHFRQHRASEGLMTVVKLRSDNIFFLKHRIIFFKYSLKKTWSVQKH